MMGHYEEWRRAQAELKSASDEYEILSAAVASALAADGLPSSRQLLLEERARQRVLRALRAYRLADRLDVVAAPAPVTAAAAPEHRAAPAPERRAAPAPEQRAAAAPPRRARAAGR